MIDVVEVEGVRSLADYAGQAELVGAVHRLREEAAKVVPRLEDRRIWMVNSTARGGGVAEMLPRMVGILRELGLDVRWAVIEVDEPAFFALTKRIHNLIHGVGDPAIGPDDVQLYERVSLSLARAMRPLLAPGDVLVVHDPQPAAMGAFLRRELDLHAIWRCHIGLDQDLPQTRAAWSLLEPYISRYDHTVFTAAEYIPHYLTGNVSTITPAIDPLTDKNRPLSAVRLTGVLCNAGLMVSHSPVLPRPYARLAERLLPDGTFGRADGPEEIGLLYRPVVTQISRWDGLKGWEPLLRAFVKIKREFRAAPGFTEHERRRLEIVRLVLAGPEPAAVQDDPEATGVLRELCDLYTRLEPELQRDVALLSLPMASASENALMVNALQRASTIVVQNSRQEGFGLTVTEAMWKRTAVLGSSACGLRQQIRDDVHGRLHPDAEDVDELADYLLDMLQGHGRRDRWGRAAQLRVHDEFLIFSQLRRWLEVLEIVVVGRSDRRSRPPSLLPPSGEVPIPR